MDLTASRFTGKDQVQLVGTTAGTEGSSPSIILMHGIGQTRHSWDASVERLAGLGHHVIALDTRGHGDSDWAPGGAYSLDILVEDLALVVATLLRPPILIGASLGGATALCAAARPGFPVRGIVLIDVVPRIEARGAERIKSFMLQNPDGFGSVSEAEAAIRAFNPSRTTTKSSGLMKNLREGADGRLRWHWDPQFLERVPPDFGPRLVEACKFIAVPVTLVRGLTSEFVSEEGVAELQALIPGTEVITLANASHMVVGDKNDEFIAGIDPFLRCLGEEILRHPK